MIASGEIKLGSGAYLHERYDMSSSLFIHDSGTPVIGLLGHTRYWFCSLFDGCWCRAIS